MAEYMIANVEGARLNEHQSVVAIGRSDGKVLLKCTKCGHEYTSLSKAARRAYRQAFGKDFYDDGGK